MSKNKSPIINLVLLRTKSNMRDLSERKTRCKKNGEHVVRHCRGWWALTVSNRRPTPCKGAALPTELSAPPENRNLKTLASLILIAGPMSLCQVQILDANNLFEEAGAEKNRPRSRAYKAAAMALPTSLVEAVPPMSGVRGAPLWGCNTFSIAPNTAS